MKLLTSLIIYICSCAISQAGVVPIIPKENIDTTRAFNVASLTEPISVSSYLYYASDDSGIGGGFRLSYKVNDFVTVRSDYQSSSFSEAAFGDEASLTVQFNYPFKDIPLGIAPYVITGTGISSFNQPDIDAIIGFGASYNIYEGVDAFIEYEFSNFDNSNQLRLGFTYWF